MVAQYWRAHPAWPAWVVTSPGAHNHRQTSAKTPPFFSAKDTLPFPHNNNRSGPAPAAAIAVSRPRGREAAAAPLPPLPPTRHGGEPTAAPGRHELYVVHGHLPGFSSVVAQLLEVLPRGDHSHCRCVLLRPPLLPVGGRFNTDMRRGGVSRITVSVRPRPGEHFDFAGGW